MDEKNARRLRVPNENEEWAMEIPLPEETATGETVMGDDGSDNQTRYQLWHKIGRGVLFIAAFLTPLLFFPFTQFPVEASKLTFIGLLLIVSLVSFFVCTIERRTFTYPRSMLALAVLVFTVIVGLSAFFSTSS